MKVDETPVSNDAGALTTVEFAPGTEGIPVTRVITILNDGTQTLTVSKVAWASYDSDVLTQAGGTASDYGAADLMVNPHVELVDAPEGAFEVLHTDTIGVTVRVRYTPPATLEDLRPSILELRSDATDFDGKTAVPVVRVGFTMPKKGPFPAIEPPNYKFTNATQVSPEAQKFFIVNDKNQGTAPFTVGKVYLEFPSTEFVLTEYPNEGTVVLPQTDPDYKPAEFSVRYQPFDDGKGDQNAVIIETSAGAPKRVPLTTALQTAAYTVSYNHIQQFDFGNINQKESRRVSITSVGDAPLTIKQLPAIEPPEARAWFTWKGYLPASKPGDPEEGTLLADSDYPRVLKKGKSIDFEITFAPPAGGDPAAIPQDGFLEVPFDPGGQVMTFELFAGSA